MSEGVGEDQDLDRAGKGMDDALAKGVDVGGNEEVEEVDEPVPVQIPGMDGGGRAGPGQRGMVNCHHLASARVSIWLSAFLQEDLEATHILSVSKSEVHHARSQSVGPVRPGKARHEVHKHR